MMRSRTALVFALHAFFMALTANAVCDGNPHNWGRIRRCDQYDAGCAEATWQKPQKCEGIGGIPNSDDPDDFIAPPCTAFDDPAEKPAAPIFPMQFTNKGFYEVQIFVKHDPLCIAQIPAMVSNGTHCYKPQEGTFNYDATNARLRIDYLRSRVGRSKMNMTEYFYHESTNVHPDITKYGIKLPDILGGICPCINVSCGIVSPTWAADAEYIGREQLAVEYLTAAWNASGPHNFTVDHWVKGPHHSWVDVQSNRIVRLWQPFNGLEVFDPLQWEESVDPTVFKLPMGCRALAGKDDKRCIQAFPDTAAVEAQYAAIADRLLSKA